MELRLPLNQDIIEKLNVGDQILLSGKILVGRDAAHERLYNMILRGNELPINLENAAIYYMGPCPARHDEVIGPCGPTTAGRMDKYTPLLIKHGLKIMIGKGKRRIEVIESIVKYKAVYLATYGGAANYIQQTIVKDKVVAFEELEAEALREIEVVRFPCIVAIDSKGRDIYELGPQRYRDYSEKM